MKRIITLLCAVLISAASVAQVSYWDQIYFSSCYSGGVNGITPSTDTVPGLSPSDDQLPVAIIGQSVHDTIYFTNYDAAAGFSIVSLKIDSIYLPAGLCWNTSKLDNTFATGERGVIYISGTPTAPAGLFKLRIIVDITIAGPVTMRNQDAESRAGLRYHLIVGCPGVIGSQFDYSDSIHTYLADTVCTTTLSAVSIRNLNGRDTICTGESVTLIAEAIGATSYRWSNGSTAPYIVADASATYTVTAYGGGNTVVSAPYTVLWLSGPTADFQLIPDPATAHSWVVVDQSTGSNLDYTWTWGDNSPHSSGATPTHTYDSAGYYTICLSVTDPATAGCAVYCDSNAYLYKNEGQMIQMRVVQYPLGVTHAGQASYAIGYYNDAVHITPAITAPADVHLYDMAGKMMMKQNNWTGTSIPVDAYIAGGVYIVSIHSNTISVSHKISIVR